MAKKNADSKSKIGPPGTVEQTVLASAVRVGDYLAGGDGRFHRIVNLTGAGTPDRKVLHFHDDRPLPVEGLMSVFRPIERTIPIGETRPRPPRAQIVRSPFALDAP
ncbi:hypothetical protein [Streptomyces sp. S1]|uniref:hypothetical protein n=1 Tax=Streptomyces sp. S1 TaxID=718288 RepID=UPI003D761543